MTEGILTAYRFTLEAGTDKKKIYISTHADDIHDTDAAAQAEIYPLMIGDASSAVGSEFYSMPLHNEKLFRVDWEGKIIATAARIGGWFMYEGDTTPPKISYNSTNMSVWRSLYSVGSASVVAGDDAGKTFYTVLDPLRDNVLAIGVPEGNVFSNHNYAKFRVLTNGRLYCTEAYLGYTPDSHIEPTNKGWIVTNNTIYSGTAKDDANNFQMSTVDFTRTIIGVARNDLRLAIGTNFAVNEYGKLFAEGVTVKTITLTGVITGTKWNITNEGKATFEDIVLNGVITGTKWNVDKDGKAVFENIEVTGGKIGNFEITEGNLKAPAGTKLIMGESEIWFNQSSMSIWSAGQLYLFSETKEVSINGNGTFTMNYGTIRSRGDISFSTSEGSRQSSVNDILDRLDELEGSIESLWDAVNSIDECNCSSSGGLGGLGGLI